MNRPDIVLKLAFWQFSRGESHMDVILLQLIGLADVDVFCVDANNLLSILIFFLINVLQSIASSLTYWH